MYLKQESTFIFAWGISYIRKNKRDFLLSHKEKKFWEVLEGTNGLLWLWTHVRLKVQREGLLGGVFYNPYCSHFILIFHSVLEETYPWVLPRWSEWINRNSPFPPPVFTVKLPYDHSSLFSKFALQILEQKITRLFYMMGAKLPLG